MQQTIQEKLELLPSDPGCYLMKNKAGEIIYVGKAKRLRQRVSSYFTGSHDNKTTKLVRLIDSFDFIITSTEKESLILEINLIKEHRPRFNVIFMDDKSYPYLKLNRKGIPVVSVSRDKKQNPNYIYFGPYPDSSAAYNMARVLNNSEPEDGILLPNTKAIYAQFNRTPKKYTDEEIEQWRQDVVKILKGNSDSFFAAIREKMLKASSELNFELAQLYKDKLQALEYISDKQQVQFSMNENFDMFNFAYKQGYIAIVGLFVRDGRLLEKTMAVSSCLEEPLDALTSFIAQFYENQPLAKQVYVPSEVSKEDLAMVLNTNVLHAQRGHKRKLLDITLRNAENQLNDQFSLLRDRQTFKDEAMIELQDALKSKDPISRIEIFDNSHISGSYAVSCCVVFDDGEPNKKLYRRYKLSSGNDDVASMKEVIYRRYFRLLTEGATMPDLVIVDGGKGQVNAALGTIRSLGLDLQVAGLVKDDRHRTHALLNQYLEELPVTQDSSLFKFMVQMQDEVHRFVINYHKHLRKAAMTKSILDEVSGLGKVRQKKLYKHFKNLGNIKAASIEELSEVIPAEVAKDLYELLHIDWKG